MSLNTTPPLALITFLQRRAGFSFVLNFNEDKKGGKNAASHRHPEGKKTHDCTLKKNVIISYDLEG